MIIELLQLWEMIVLYKIHILAPFFIFWIIIPALWIRCNGRKYKHYEGTSRPVAVIVPVYKEDYEIFERCLHSIDIQKPDEFIIVIDSQDQKLMEITQRNNATLLKLQDRKGKREALAQGWLKVKNEIIVQVDSDVILEPHCLEEITKPFDNPKIYGVSTHHTPTPSKSWAATQMGNVAEANMNVNGRALDGALVVVDGRANAWRKEHLLKIREGFLNDYFLGVKSIPGDDRYITREALKAGKKVVYQETAGIQVKAQDSFSDYVRQQIRWRKTGIKFFSRDIKEKNYQNKLYTYKSFTYYTATPFFILSIILDTLFFSMTLHFWNWWFIPIMMIIGSALISAVLQLIFYGKIKFPQSIILKGFTGIFVMMPATLYSWFTVRSQDRWMTRWNKGNMRLYIILALLGVISMGLFIYGALAEADQQYG